ncbi:hypothetical protein L226DRAFT_564275 [Lentinus tigrinus ALCF2SS1-7]|uniref:uncharacterized protein n=1 Tax=Lentinus tigrinus ALCF2SS1-7 TaxID=1328758 RepID=UPI0011663462|nr:hypothetical protein L226DRAFT_564275 [Lentinus tigrinus ALCF2SS1-7]
MCPSALVTTDVTSDAPLCASNSATQEDVDSDWDFFASGTGLEGLPGLRELRWFEAPFLPVPPPSGGTGELDLEADPPSLLPWTNFYKTYEETLDAGPGPEAPTAVHTPPSPLAVAAAMAQTTQHDEHLLQAAFMQLGLDKSAPRDVPTVNPLLTNTLAAIPSVAAGACRAGEAGTQVPAERQARASNFLATYPPSRAGRVLAARFVVRRSSTIVV